MRCPRLALALVATALLVGCSDRPTEPDAARLGPPTRPSLEISDGAHGGNPSFYFLPPLVPPPASSGTFDGSLAPEVRVCELAGATCGAVVATFSGSQVKVVSGAYQATWKTKGAGLDPAKTYRIQVLLPTPYGTRLLGHADVVVLANGGQVKTVDGDQFVAVINGGTVPIRFWIEGGATPSGWQYGDVISYQQTNWAIDETGVSGLLSGRFDEVYASTGGLLEVGVPGTDGHSMMFNYATVVLDYLPASGEPGPLTGDHLDATTSASGAFGGEVVALTLNVDYADAGVLGGSSKMRFGDLTLCNVAGSSGLHGLSVRQVLGIASTLLGGGSLPYDIREIHPVVVELNGAFANGVVSPFALQHLGTGSCAAVNWRDGDLVTYTQLGWSTGLLELEFDRIYSKTGTVLQVGVPGTAGYSIIFTGSPAVLNYLPAVGNAAPLNADLLDPTMSASGAFGGEVTALQLNVDFSDDGVSRGAAGIPFGDLTICGLSSPASLSGLAIREVLAFANSALGGGPAPLSVSELYQIAAQLNASFELGHVGPFARDHLRHGGCPSSP